MIAHESYDGPVCWEDAFAELEAKNDRLHDVIRELQAKLAEARAREAVTDGASQRFADLSMELGKDKARLDWLDKHRKHTEPEELGFYNGWQGWSIYKKGTMPKVSVRAAIDAAMQNTQENTQ